MISRRTTAGTFPLILVVLTANNFLSACSNLDIGKVTVKTARLSDRDWSLFPTVHANTQDLPKCNKGSDGRLIWVPDNNSFLVCNGISWSEINVRGERGEAGADGSSNGLGIQGITTTPSGHLSLMPTSGRVGIGTADPSVVLEINGAIDQTVSDASPFIPGFDFKKRGQTGDAQGPVKMNSELGYHAFNGWDGSSFGRGALAISRSTEDFSTTGHGANYEIYTTPNGSTGIVSRLLVDQNGFIGIGTRSPGSVLHVSASSFRPQVRIGIDNGSNAVNGTDVGDLEFSARYSNVVNEIAAIRAQYTGDGTTRSGDMVLATGNNSHPIERIRVRSSGNVGIGTSNPQSQLQVSGYIQLDLTTGAPLTADCDAPSERGRMKVDSASSLLYICMDSGWVAK